VTSVLVVDDDMAFRTTIGRDLADQGFDVRLAQNADEASEILTIEPTDILLTDLRMPGADGIDLLDRVRSLSPRTRAILMSGFASARDYQRAVECGAVRVLCKPFTSAELLQAIRQAVDCETGFRGSIHGLSLVDLLQMFHFARRSLAIVVDGWAPGHVYLEDGRIIHAVYQDQVGVPALRAILAMPAGSLRTMVLPAATPHSITGNFDALLLDALRSLDEATAEHDATSFGDFGDLDDFEDPVASPTTTPPRPRLEVFFERLRRLDGYAAACLVDSESGVVLGSDTHAADHDVHAAAAAYAELYRLQRATTARLVPDDRLEDVVITLPGQLHVLHALAAHPELFLYVVLERRDGNLMMARFALAAAEAAHDG
jgi:CheY-like chemotaxis protein